MSWEDFKGIQQVINHANERFTIRPFVSQGDWDGRSLTIQVTDDGVVKKKPGLTLNLKWINKTAYNQGVEPFKCVNEDASIFTVTYPNNMMTAGKVEAQIQVLYKGNSTILKTFEITVQGDVNDPKAYINQSSFGVLEKALSTVNQYDTAIATLDDEKETKKKVEEIATELENKVRETNDSLEYKIERVNGGPGGFFNTEAELKNAYPNGSDRFFIVNGNQYWWKNGIWINGGVYPGLGIADNSVTPPKLSFQAAVVNPNNLFNSTTITKGRYVNYQNGGIPTLAGYNASDYIEILPNTRYKIIGTNEQLAFYGDKQVGSYISGVVNADSLSNSLTPVNARYMRISVKDTELYKVTLKQRFGIDNDNFVPENITYLSEQLGLVPDKVITVRKDGTGDYTRLRDAIAAAERGTTIKIYPGTYSLTDEYTAEEINETTFQGFFKDRDVSWEGVGIRGSIILLGDLEGYSVTTITRVSTIHLRGGGNLSNIMTIGKNVRYAMHDDDGWPNVKKRFSTCDFKKQGTSGGYAQAVGGGTYSGSEHIYDDCTFETDWDDVPVSYHNNINFKLPSKVEFIDCNYTTPGVYQLRIGSMGSGMKDIINLIGNRFSKVLVKEEKMNDVGIDFLIKGRGNRQFSIDVQTTAPVTLETDFVEDVVVNTV